MMKSDIVPIILAAGDSSRMGYPKALLPLGSVTFLTHIMNVLERLNMPVPLLVLGKHADRIRPFIASRQVRVLINPSPERGQSSSIQIAVRNLEESCVGCMIWPVDQPAVSDDLVRNLIRLFFESDPALVMPCVGQKRGHPAIFHSRTFGELRAEMDPGKGLKAVVLRHRHETALFQTEEIGTVADVDTPEDYFKLTGETPEAALERLARKSGDASR